MKITTCIAVNLSDVITAVHIIKSVYGKHHIIYIQGPKNTYFRNEILKAEEEYFDKQPELFPIGNTK